MAESEELKSLLMKVKEELKLDIEQWTGSKLGKEYNEVVIVTLLI